MKMIRHRSVSWPCWFSKHQVIIACLLGSASFVFEQLSLLAVSSFVMYHVGCPLEYKLYIYLMRNPCGLMRIRSHAFLITALIIERMIGNQFIWKLYNKIRFCFFKREPKLQKRRFRLSFLRAQISLWTLCQTVPGYGQQSEQNCWS